MDEDDDDLFDLIAAEEALLSSDYVVEALLQKQYFPRVKKDGEELPPLFFTTSLTEGAAKAVSLIGTSKHAAWVELRTRRFDGLVRRLGIPHPVPYTKLVLHIRDHWDDLVKKLASESSQITPQYHADGRVIQMDYIDHVDEHGKYTRLAQGNEYMVKADVSNCFPSIYSHALDWALRTKPAAKSDRDRRKWQSRLDEYSRNCVNQESKGLLIGPAVSNILAELVLQRVDERLASYSYVRYIDDYTAYFPTRDEAEQFLVDLQRALSEYRLDLNTRKTYIKSLREGVADAWMAEVLSHIPADDSDLSAVRFLQHAESMAHHNPSASVMKFAAKTLLGRGSRVESASIFVVDEIMRITRFHPEILPILGREISKLGRMPSSERERLARLLRAQLLQAVRRSETDSVLWLLYILRSQLRRPLGLRTNGRKSLLQLNDDLIWIALAVLVQPMRAEVAAQVQSLKYIDETDRQEHWLSRYELWRVGLLKDADCSAPELSWMKTLQKHNVCFSSL